ncbi:MAG: RluA family pseudouridine synthase [Myxococcota bacterium]|nr:RluA family pseudouridine synthase [Myxococcota bacterium]
MSELEAKVRALAQTQPGATAHDGTRMIRVPGRLHGKTVLTCLQALCPHIPNERWVEAYAAGDLEVDHRKCALDTPIGAGAIVYYTKRQITEPLISPDIRVLFEDERVVVVAKPAPLPVHPSGRFEKHTLVRLLEAVCPGEKFLPAHRLDADTSGIQVLTKDKETARFIQGQFQRRAVKKAYLLKVRGYPQALRFSVDARIENKPGKHGRREVSERFGVEALTHFTWVASLPKNESILMAQPVTGRTNQIRIHANHVGHPIVGDTGYGLEANDAPEMVTGKHKLCLHAWCLSLEYPRGKIATFRLPAPGWVPMGIH